MMTDSPHEIVIGDVTENEDGSAGITVTMGGAARDSVVQLGLEFIFTCAAANMGIRDALQMILTQGDLQE